MARSISAKDGSGKRQRIKVSAKNKTDVYQKLKDKRSEIEAGIRTSGRDTVQAAVDTWLDQAMAGRAAKTVQTQRELLDPLLAEIGGTVLRDLTADDVREGLTVIAATRTTRTVRDTRASLVRAITYAQSHGKVGRNVASLVTPPPGLSPGRPSRSLTVTQARAVLKAAEKDRLNAYFVLSMFTGIRTEEARALRWDHVDLDGPTPNVAVWRSVRAGGETKTRRSRRTLSLPERAVEALRAHREAQAKERAEMEPLDLWTETGLVFTTHFGKELDAANVRRSFRRICAAARIGRELEPTRASAHVRLDHVGVGHADREDRGPGRPRWRISGHRADLPPAAQACAYRRGRDHGPGAAGADAPGGPPARTSQGPRHRVPRGLEELSYSAGSAVPQTDRVDGVLGLGVRELLAVRRVQLLEQRRAGEAPRWSCSPWR